MSWHETSVTGLLMSYSSSLYHVSLPEREYAKPGNEEGYGVNEQNYSRQFGELQIVQ